MKNGKILLLIVFFIWIFTFVALDDYGQKQDKVQQSSVKNQVSVREAAKVLRVVDGDTIRVLVQGKEDTVRLIGIDAPETIDPKKSAQCFGKEASEKAKEVLENKTIILESDSTQGDRDEYGRLLRYIFLEDGTNFDKFILREGYAYEYTFKNNPYKYQSEFIQAEKKAKEENKGLWSSCQAKP
jgi:micrococcal nuclease